MSRRGNQYMGKSKTKKNVHDMRFNLKRVMNARNIIHPVAYLLKAGISNNIAVGFMNDQLGSIKWTHFQKLCLYLNCTPNDLFSWEGTPADLPQGHELHKLVRKPAQTVQDKLKTLSPDKLEKLVRMIEEEAAEDQS